VLLNIAAKGSILGNKQADHVKGQISRPEIPYFDQDGIIIQHHFILIHGK